jgi:hypothetical protein
MKTIKIISLFACITLMLLFVISFVWHISDKGTGMHTTSLIDKFSVICFVSLSILVPGTIIGISISKLDQIYDKNKY